MPSSSPPPPLVEGSLAALASATAQLDDHDVAGPGPIPLADLSTAATAPPGGHDSMTGGNGGSSGVGVTRIRGDDDVHRCFICLEDQTPADNWTTPCKCSLEGHQQCMLSWVADLESRAKAVKCPLCQAKIEVLDRFDIAVYLSDAMTAYYSNVSPLVLVSLIGTSTLLSSAFYGMHALEVFAGPGAVMRYIYKKPTQTGPGLWDTFLPRLRESGSLLGLVSRDNDGILGDNLGLEPCVDLTRFLSLSLVGPALVLNRISFGDIVLIPTSLMVGQTFPRRSQLRANRDSVCCVPRRPVTRRFADMAAFAAAGPGPLSCLQGLLCPRLQDVCETNRQQGVECIDLTQPRRTHGCCTDRDPCAGGRRRGSHQRAHTARNCGRH